MKYKSFNFLRKFFYRTDSFHVTIFSTHTRKCFHYMIHILGDLNSNEHINIDLEDVLDFIKDSEPVIQNHLKRVDIIRTNGLASNLGISRLANLIYIPFSDLQGAPKNIL